MKQVSHHLHQQVHIWLIMALTIAPIALMGQLMGLSMSTFNLLLFIVFIEVVIWTLFKNPMVYFVAIFLSLGGLYGLYSWQHPWYTLIYNGWQSFSLNFGNYVAGYDLLTPRHSFMALILVASVFIIFIRLLLSKFPIHFIYFILSLGYLIYGWYLHMDTAYYFIIMHCVLYLLFYTTSSYIYQPDTNKIIAFRGSESLFVKWLTTSSRYVILILLGAILLPATGPMIVWKDVEQTLIERYPVLKDLRQDIDQSRTFSNADLFNLSQTGYSDESGNLGGPVVLNDSLALEVISPYPLYLRGNVLSHYDGRKWDYGQRLKIEKETDKQLLREVNRGEEIQVTITHKGLSSFTLFTPYQISSVSIDRPGKMWIDINQQITLLGARYVGESYHLTAILAEDSEVAVQASAAILFNREDYLQLPDLLPSRVKDLAIKESASGQTPYEKALLLTSYLRNNYKYSLSPDYLPTGEDFVDHFLFEEKEGYCTYFATSLSILLRTLDIPTRYVEGFRTPDQSENGRYEVKLSHGHAWVEAYFDGYGWVTLEATPAYQVPSAPTDTRLLVERESVDLYSLEDEKAYMIAMRDVNIEDNSLNESSDLEASDDSILWQSIMKILPSLVIMGLISIIPIRFIYLRKVYQTYRKSPPSREKLIHLYHNITELFGHGGYPRKTGETTTEYAHRVKKQFYDDTHNFEEVTAYYLQVKYGQDEAYEKGFNITDTYLNFVEQRLKHKLGRLTYYKLKYVSGHLYTRHDHKLKH